MDYDIYIYIYILRVEKYRNQLVADGESICKTI